MCRTTYIASPSRLLLGQHLVFAVVVGSTPLEPVSPLPRIPNGSTPLLYGRCSGFPQASSRLAPTP